MIEMRLPDDVIDGLPEDPAQHISYLRPFVDKMVDDYEQSFLERTKGSAIGSRLTRYERAQLTDFVFDRLMRPLRAKAKSLPHVTETTL